MRSTFSSSIQSQSKWLQYASQLSAWSVNLLEFFHRWLLIKLITSISRPKIIEYESYIFSAMSHILWIFQTIPQIWHSRVLLRYDSREDSDPIRIVHAIREPNWPCTNCLTRLNKVLRHINSTVYWSKQRIARGLPPFHSKESLYFITVSSEHIF